MGKEEEEPTFEELIEKLKDKDSSTRSSAVEALGNIKDEIPRYLLFYLLNAYDIELSPSVKKNILKVMKKIDPDVHDNLIREKERVEELNFINRRE